MSGRTPGSANNYAGPRRQVNPVDVPDRDSARVMGHLEGALPRTGLLDMTDQLLERSRLLATYLDRDLEVLGTPQTFGKQRRNRRLQSELYYTRVYYILGGRNEWRTQRRTKRNS